MEKGKKLCDVEALEIKRVGDPVKEVVVPEEPKGIARYLYQPPEGLAELLQTPINLPDGKQFTVDMAQHNGQNVAVLSEVGLVSGTGQPEVDVLTFGVWDNIVGWHNPEDEARYLALTSSPETWDGLRPSVIEIPEPLRGIKVPEHWHGGEGLDRPHGPLPGDIVLDIGTMQQHVVAMSPERQALAHDLICDTLLQMVKLDILRNRKRQNRTKKMRGSVIRNRSKQSFRKPR